MPDSEIGFEVWLPRTWNRKLVGIGNGGASGLIFYSDMAEPLSRGYAVAATDTGHSGGMADWSFALHSEKLIDSGYRAVHETTVKSKAVVEAHYGTAAMRSYWNGCSPAAARASRRRIGSPRTMTASLRALPPSSLTRHDSPSPLEQATADGVEPMTRDKLKLMTEAAIAECDAADGVRDRTVTDPMACRFDPACWPARRATGRIA